MNQPLADADALWAASGPDVLSKLASSANGLTSKEAARRLVLYGPNRLEDKPPRRLLLDFLKRFTNPLVLVLLGAATIAALTGDPVSFAIIATIVALSVSLDFVQEQRAQNAADKLRDRVALKATVLRDGAKKDIAAAEIVPGDVLALGAGDLVPADCRVLDAKDLFVNQALLTGESYPTEKLAEPKPGQSNDTGALPATAVFAGSSIISGTAHVVVAKTGRSTQLGAIAKSLRTEPPPTAFTVGIHKFGMLILRMTVLLVLFVLLVNLLFHRPLLESFLFALALAVGLTPELLPMVVSVTLARGAMRMSEKQVIVKRLSAIHDLGSMDVLCSDKTGTLTQAKIALARAVDFDGNESKDALQATYINASFETGLKNPLDEAILARKGMDLTGWTKIDEVPFDFERRRISVLVESAGGRRLIVKGAPEDVLALSSSFDRKGSAAPLDDSARKSAADALARFGHDGFRVLGVAWRDTDVHCEHAHVEDEKSLVFGGFVLFLDPPKETAAAALASLSELGVTVKVITGDNEHITEHVCDAIGLPTQTLLMGSELATLSDEALIARVQNVNVFCRVNPSQKARIIGALRRAGHVVGYLGDGINDAPSLHAADVGLSVEGAVDVAKQAAAVILLRNDLGVVADGVREGRRTFANIMKYVMMGTSSNFGNMFSMAGAVLFLPFLPMLPIQILLNNLLYDVSEIAIPMDNVDQAAIARPEHWDMTFVRNFMFVFGPLSSLFDFLTFWLLLHLFHAGEALFHTGWFLESLMTQILVIFVIRTRGGILNSKPAALLIASSLGALAVAILLPFTPLGRLLGFVAPSIGLIAALAGITIAYLFLTDVVKRLFLRSRLAVQAV